MLTLSIGRKKRLHAVTFSPSGRDLAAVGGDNVLRVWDSFTGDLTHSVPVEETSSGYALVFLDDTRLLFRGVGLFVKDLAADPTNQAEDTPEPIDPQNPLAPKMARPPDGRHLAEVEKTESIDWPRDGLRLYDTTDWVKLPVPADA